MTQAPWHRARAQQPWLNPPTHWAGSLPEWALYWAHLRLGLRDGIEFTYQAPALGGRTQAGGAVIDFMENDVGIAIRVQGLHFHDYAGGDRRSFDILQQLSLEQSGIRVIDLRDDTILQSPIGSLKNARAGIGG